MKINILTILGILLFGFNGLVRADWEETFSEITHPFLSTHCIDCHDEESKQGGLNMDALSRDLADPEVMRRWVLLFDKVTEGEMPPKQETENPDPKQRDTFLASLSDALEVADRKRSAESGRAVLRRLNRLEYEHTLRDFLDAQWLQIKAMLPEDGEAHRFNKVGEALDVSHVQMAQYLKAADYALREVIAPQVKRPDASAQRFYAREQRTYAGKMRYNQFNRQPDRATFPLLDHQADLPVLKGKGPLTVGPSDPEKRDRESFGVVASAYEPIEPRFDSFEAPLPGLYRLRFNGYTFWAEPETKEQWWKSSREKISRGRRDEPVLIYAHQNPGLLRKLGGFDLTPDPVVRGLDVWLVSGETIRPDPARLFRSRPPWPWHNPLATQEGQPGVAFKWLEVEGPLYDQWPSAGHRLLFGDVPFSDLPDGSGVDVLSENEEQDAEWLLRSFMKRAYRQPVREADVERFLALTKTALETGHSFKDAMIAGYSAVLCSPGFIYLDEKPGKLRGDALAARLSYFLWNSEPDPALRERVSNGELKRPADWRAQADRMLDDPRARRFVDAFSDYWLDLRRVNDTAPDAGLYPDYYLDDLLVESAVEETQLFIADLIRDNRPSRNLVSADYAMLNERLAAHYGIPNVEGIEVRRVSLPADSPRGGLLTQASVLKVTANGTTTSPVLRGAWVMERILGRKPPPPPPSVPAIEPDTRGAITIREQLDKHREVESCKACHAQIDPAGFALENFDVLGGWREQYRGLDEAIESTLEGYGKNGQPFVFHLARRVDASGVLPGGGTFENIREFKTRLLEDERQIARNLVRQLVIYSTGAPIGFGDRSKIERILDRTKASGYGVRSILLELVASELFSTK